MARRRFYRRRFYRKGNRWSSRIVNLNDQQTVPANTSIFFGRALATNPAQEISTISQKYTVKNVFMQFNIESNLELSSVDNLQLFIMYIPQGYSASASTPYDHPEWIMAQRYIGTPTASNNPGYGPLSVRTRLSRTLDTGDEIRWMLLGYNSSSGSPQTINIRGIVRFNTKAN